MVRHGPYGTGGARHDDGLGAVDGGDGDVPGEERCHLVLARPQRGHGPALRQRLHQEASCGDQARGVRQRQGPADVGGDQFADGVAGEEVGADTPGLQEPEQRHLEGEQCGLRVPGEVQRGFVLADDADERAVEVDIERGDGLVEGLREGGVGAVEPPAHAEALGSLAGEEEGRRPAAGTSGVLPGHERGG